jgi:transposase
MDAEKLKSLMEQRAELEKLLRGLVDTRDDLYTPGITMVSDQPPPANEQVALEIEELQAAIAQIDEALKNASKD